MTAAQNRDQILLEIRERIVSYYASKGESAYADDIAQETVTILVTKYGHVTESSEMTKLAIKTAQYTAFSLRRKHRPSREMPISEKHEPASPSVSPEQALIDYETRERVNKAIHALSPRCRELFGLKLDGFSYAEIAAKTGVKIAALYVQDLRCRKQMTDKLREGGEF